MQTKTHNNKIFLVRQLFKSVITTLFCGLLLIFLVPDIKAQVHTAEVNVESTPNGYTGVGTESPETELHVAGDLTVGKSGRSGRIYIKRNLNGSSTGFIGYSSTTENNNFKISNGTGGGYMTFWTNQGGSGSTTTERLRLDHNGLRVNNGIINTNGSNLRLQTSGSERMRIKTNGRVGVSNTNPGVYNFAGNQTDFGSKLDVNGEIFARYGLHMGTGGSYKGSMDFNVFTVSTNQNMRSPGKPTGFSMKMQSNGGATYGDEPVKLNFFAGSSSVFSGTNNALLNNLDATPVLTLWAKNGTRRIGVRRESPSYELDVAGTIRANNVSASSDERWKKDIRSVEKATAIIAELNPVSYLWKVEEFPSNDFDEKKHYGFIAQEIEKTLPELVSTDEDGYKSVEYNGLIAILVKVLQEKNHEIAEMKAELTALREIEGRVEKLERSLTRSSNAQYGQ